MAAVASGAGAGAGAGATGVAHDDLPIAVVGAGLVGTTVAIYLAREGYKVHLLEARDDLRKEAEVDPNE